MQRMVLLGGYCVVCSCICYVYLCVFSFVETVMLLRLRTKTLKYSINNNVCILIVLLAGERCKKRIRCRAMWLAWKHYTKRNARNRKRHRGWRDATRLRCWTEQRRLTTTGSLAGSLAGLLAVVVFVVEWWCGSRQRRRRSTVVPAVRVLRNNTIVVVGSSAEVDGKTLFFSFVWLSAVCLFVSLALPPEPRQSRGGDCVGGDGNGVTAARMNWKTRCASWRSRR